MQEFNNTANNESANTDCIYFNECYLQLRNNGYCFYKCEDFRPQLHKEVMSNESQDRKREGKKMVDPTINKVYHKARELHDKKCIDSELWYAILEMKDAHMSEIDFGKRFGYFEESEDKK